MQSNVNNNPRINQTETIPILTTISLKRDSLRYAYTVEFYLSRLIGTASHLDMHKIQIVGIFFEYRLQEEF
jgi:hypothetical protein